MKPDVEASARWGQMGRTVAVGCAFPGGDMAVNSDTGIDESGAANEVVAFAVALNRAANQTAEALKATLRMVASKVREHEPPPDQYSGDAEDH